MANPYRGQVSFDAVVDEELARLCGLPVGTSTFTLRLGANAICELEEAMGKSLVEICSEFDAWAKDPKAIRLSVVRTVFWAALRDHHPDVDLRAAGELITASGGLTRTMELISQSVARAYGAETKGARPRKPAAPSAGTG